MNLDIITLAAEYSNTFLLETQLAHNELILTTAKIAQKNNSALIKIINSNEYKECVNLKEIVEEGIKAHDKISDSIRLGKGLMYFADGERYRLLRDEQTFKYFKHKCIQEFKKLSDPEIITQYKKQMGAYLPKKYLR
jgi:hypothetical protein